MGSYMLMLAAAASIGSGSPEPGLTEFPPLFVHAWGDGGPQCAQYPGRAIITPTSIRYRQWSANPADSTQLAENQLRVRFRGASPAERATMTVTVGTTGSRLFIERSGRVIAISTICAP